MKRTTYRDISKPECEHRNYVVTDRFDETGNGKIVLKFQCPFCTAEMRAYQWSLCGGGKRCDCGALFGGTGQAHKLVDGAVKV